MNGAGEGWACVRTDVSQRYIWIGEGGRSGPDLDVHIMIGWYALEILSPAPLALLLTVLCADAAHLE